MSSSKVIDQLSKRLVKSAPSKLNGEKRKTVLRRILEKPDLAELLTKQLNNIGVVRQDIGLVNRQMATLKVYDYSFIANSKRFRESFLEDIRIIRKNKNNIVIRSITQESIHRYNSVLQIFIYNSATQNDGSIGYNNRLLGMINLVNPFYEKCLESFTMTSKYDSLFKLCKILTTLAKTLIQYMDYNTRGTDLLEGQVLSTSLENRIEFEGIVQFTRPYLDKYVFLAYEYNKFCMLHYIKNKSKSSNIEKILVLIKNIIDLDIYKKKMYPALKESKQIDNDRICFLFLKYYFKGIPEKLTPYYYRHLTEFTTQTFLKITKTYEDFKTDTKLHDELFNKCLDFIIKRKGLAYELANTSRFNKLNLKFTNLPPV